MQQIEVTDEFLYKYMPMVDETIIKELEDNTDYEYQFSAKFELKMRKLLWKEAHPRVSAVFRELRRTAVMSICAVILFSNSAEYFNRKISLYFSGRFFNIFNTPFSISVSI